MAKGGNDQRSNGSRFKKPHNGSNSFVTKVASRVSDYLGGWFGTPLKSSQNVEATETPRSSADATEKRLFDDVEPRQWNLFSQGVFDDDIEAISSPAKRFKMSDKEKLDIDFSISPIPSTSGMFQNAVNHNTFEVPKREDFGISVAGPSTLQREKFTRANDIPPTTSSTTDVKANGATDNHSDSSESTSGCSSLVPQSDRLSQSAYVCTNRKRNLEEKLKYARQLQQSRASMYLNRSIPVSEAPGGRKKPSFDVTVYGSPTLDKSLLREKLINSPFYTGQTSYGGASAHRLSRNTFYSHRNPRLTPEKREGIQMQVKPSHHGSTEDLTNMSHTAKKILEALEQFSTPVNDAKRIPLSRNAPLSTKKRRFNEMSETRLRLSTPASPLNPNPGPVITGLNVPTVPDLLKLKRLERIQNSTAAARQVAVQKQEYTLPKEPEKHTGKIVTKLKNKEKDVPMEKLEEVNLPKISLPITTLPKFDFQLPAVPKPAEKPEQKSKFVFSAPIPVSVNEVPVVSAQTKNFKFSDPLNPLKTESVAPLTNFMSSDAVAKLKRKSIKDEPVKVAAVPSTSPELKTGSVMDFFKSANKNKWECPDCMLWNKDSDTKCVACEAAKPGTKVEKPEPKLKFGVEKPETEGIKSPADSSTKTQSNGPQSGFLGVSTSVGVFTFGVPPKKEEPKPESPKPAENSIKTQSNGPQAGFLGVSTSVGVFTFGVPPKKEEPKPESPKPAENTSSFLVTSTSGILKKVDPEKPETKIEAVKPFTFGVPKSSKPICGSSTEEKPKEEPPKLVLGPNSTSGSLETVSSSTSDFSFGQVKSTETAKPTFQFKPLTPTETRNNAEVTKPESTVATTVVATSTSVSITPSFASPPPIFNNTKLTFGTIPTSSGFGAVSGSQTTESSVPVTSPSTFSTTGLNSQPAPAPSFPALPQTDKPAENTFGASSFSATPFAPTQNVEPAKTFSFGSNATFGANPTPAPSMCSGFLQPNPTEKPAAPFTFGASTPAMTTASTGFSAPNFGTSKPDSRPAFSFGQTPTPNFGFGSTAPSTNFFGSFRQSKPENSIGGSGLAFGASPSTPSAFGQSSAPAAFESAAPPKFVFGSSGNQQQESAPVFKFGAAAAQPASAPPGTGFSLSVPEKFNFSQGQIPTFSATPSAEDPSAVRKTRKVIKAVRRTARDLMRRPQ